MLQNQKRQVREYLSHSAEQSPPAGVPQEPQQIKSPPSNQTSTASEATEVSADAAWAPLSDTPAVSLSVSHALRHRPSQSPRLPLTLSGV